jgi:hypothetical protein
MSEQLHLEAAVRKLQEEPAPVLPEEAHRLIERVMNGWHLEAAHALNHRGGYPVYRLFLRNENAFQSQILKRNAAPGTINRDFESEYISYLFLDMLGAKFPFRPKLLGREGDHILIEDLGPDAFQYPDDRSAGEAICSTFALLHTCAYGREAEYESLRAMHGLPHFSEDARRYGQPGTALMAANAVAVVDDMMSVLQVAPAGKFQQLTEEIIQRICDPASAFRSFVHDDLSGRRQSISIDGKLFLIDFEHSKYFHILMDIAKPMMGKFIINMQKNNFEHAHPNFEYSLLDLYREKHEALNGKKFTEADWLLHYGSALTFQTLLIIGRMREFDISLLVHSVAANVRMVLLRLVRFLKDNPFFTELCAVLESLCMRIVAPQ